MNVRFVDRRDAGRRLAAMLRSYRATSAFVLGIPRGGVLVATAVAESLSLPVGAIAVKKVGCPFNRELAVGAVAGDGTTVINHDAVAALLISREELESAVQSALQEARRCQDLYGTSLAAIGGRDVIIVDDGLATGYTAIAAARYAKAAGVGSVMIAVPVAARQSSRLVALECDRLVAVTVAEDLESVGQWYDDFRPVDDDEVMRLLSGEA